MPKKTTVKKKAWQEGCRRKVVRDGLVNNAAGGWITATSGRRCDEELRAGYKVGRRRP